MALVANGACMPSGGMFDRLTARLARLAGSRHAEFWLAAVSFAESSFFPVPPDALLLPMVAARPHRAVRLAAICTVASVLGGCLGYAIGAAFFDSIARPILHLYHADGDLGTFRAWYARWGLAVILIKGLTPIPYKLVTIASGAAHFNLWVFVAASIVTRGARFFLEAVLLRRYGGHLREIWDARPRLVLGGAAAGAVLLVAALRFL